MDDEAAANLHLGKRGGQTSFLYSNSILRERERGTCLDLDRQSTDQQNEKTRASVQLLNGFDEQPSATGNLLNFLGSKRRPAFRNLSSHHAYKNK